MARRTLRELPDLGGLLLLAEVVRRGGVGAAGRELGLTQPQASRMIAALERELGLTLLRRGPSGSIPTDEGRLIVGWSDPVLQAADRLMAGVDSLRATADDDIRIGASLTIGEHLAPLWLGVFAARHPHHRVQLRVANSASVVAELRSGTVDLGFVETPRRPAGLHTTVVATDELVVVVAPRHPWTRRASVSLAELAATPLVVRETGSGTRETLEAALAGYDRVPPAMELSSTEAIRTAVTAGAAPAVLSGLAIDGPLRAGQLRIVPLTDGPLVRRLRAVWRDPRRPSGWTAEFLQIARRG